MTADEGVVHPLPTHVPVGSDELAGGAGVRAMVSLLVGLGLAGAYLGAGGGGLPAIARRAMTMAIPQWHTTEPVNALVYGTRAFDTVGETFVLVGAVVSVMLLSRRQRPRPEAPGEALMARRERAGRAQEDDQSPQARKAEESEERGTEEAGEPTGRRQPAPDPDAGMGEVVKVATRVLLPILFAAGIMIYAWGYSPGGGFPAGTVVAGIALLVYAANGVGSLGRLGSTSHLEAIEVVASLGILALALSGLVLAGSVTANVLPLGRVGTVTGGGNLQLLSGIELLEVATGVLVTILALLGMHHDWSDDR